MLKRHLHLQGIRIRWCKKCESSAASHERTSSEKSWRVQHCSATLTVGTNDRSRLVLLFVSMCRESINWILSIVFTCLTTFNKILGSESFKRWHIERERAVDESSDATSKNILPWMRSQNTRPWIYFGSLGVKVKGHESERPFTFSPRVQVARVK